MIDLLAASSVVAVLAHPDDIKSVTGVAQRALANGSSVALIQVTKGEALNSAARSTLAPLEMGQLRMGELRAYLGRIGIPESNLFVLGIPDGSHALCALRDDFFRAEGDPYLDPLFGTDRVTYDDVYRPGLPFYGQALLETLEDLLAELKPELVLTHHPWDDHADHRGVSFFARRACRRLYHTGRLASSPAVYASLVYYRRFTWPPAGDSFYIEAIRDRFPRLRATQFCLTEAELARKREASMIFTPTLSVEYILSNMKKDEVLWRL